MSMYSLLQNKPVPTVPDIEDALAGNLCRCTGYCPILDAFVPFTKGEGSGKAPPKTNGKTQCHQAVCRGSKRALNGSSACVEKNGCKRSTEVPPQLAGALHNPQPTGASPLPFKAYWYAILSVLRVLRLSTACVVVLAACRNSHLSRMPCTLRLPTTVALQGPKLHGIDARPWKSCCSAS